MSKNEDRGSDVAPYIHVALRRGVDADLLDKVHELVPIVSRTRIGLIAMRVGLSALAKAGAKERAELFAKHGGQE